MYACIHLQHLRTLQERIIANWKISTAAISCAAAIFIAIPVSSSCASSTYLCSTRLLDALGSRLYAGSTPSLPSLAVVLFGLCLYPTARARRRCGLLALYTTIKPADCGSACQTSELSTPSCSPSDRAASSGACEQLAFKCGKALRIAPGLSKRPDLWRVLTKGLRLPALLLKALRYRPQFRHIVAIRGCVAAQVPCEVPAISCTSPPRDVVVQVSNLAKPAAAVGIGCHIKLCNSQNLRTTFTKVPENSTAFGSQGQGSKTAKVSGGDAVGRLIGSMGADVDSPYLSIVKGVVRDAHLLQFTAITGDAAADVALRLHGLPGPCGHQDSLYGVPDTDQFYLGWDALIHEEKPGLHYWSWRRHLRSGLFMYMTRTIFEDAEPADVRAFYFDDTIRRSWDTTLLDLSPALLAGSSTTPAAGLRSLETTVMQARVRFPKPMAPRQYLYCRRVWNRPADGGCYCISRACVMPPGCSAGRQSSGRSVHINDFAAGCVVRATQHTGRAGRPAAEMVMVYFEDPSVRAGLVNMGIRKGMWNAQQNAEAAFRLFQQALVPAAIMPHIPVAGGDVRGGCSTDLLTPGTAQGLHRHGITRVWEVPSTVCTWGAVQVAKARQLLLAPLLPALHNLYGKIFCNLSFAAMILWVQRVWHMNAVMSWAKVDLLHGSAGSCTTTFKMCIVWFRLTQFLAFVWEGAALGSIFGPRRQLCQVPASFPLLELNASDDSGGEADAVSVWVQTGLRPVHLALGPAVRRNSSSGGPRRSRGRRIVIKLIEAAAAKLAHNLLSAGSPSTPLEAY